LAHAQRAFLAGQNLGAAELQAMGVLHQVVDAAEHADAVAKLAQHLAQLAPLAVQGMKASLRETADATTLQSIRAREAATHASADLAEGVAATRAKRQADFKGH
jgi:enoyl-CoA hydratase/carnithine racemase